MNGISLQSYHTGVKGFGWLPPLPLPSSAHGFVLFCFFFNGKVETEIGEIIYLRSHSKLWRCVGIRINNPASQMDHICMQSPLLPRQLMCTDACYSLGSNNSYQFRNLHTAQRLEFPRMVCHGVGGRGEWLKKRGDIYSVSTELSVPIYQVISLCTKNIRESLRQISWEWCLENWK